MEGEQNRRNPSHAYYNYPHRYDRTSIASRRLEENRRREGRGEKERREGKRRKRRVKGERGTEREKREGKGSEGKGEIS